MKQMILILTVIFFVGKATGQIDSFSLKKFVPNIAVQSRANCYSFAGAHIGFTTQYLFKQNSETPNSKTSFSFEFVDDAIKHFNKKYGKRKFRDSVSVYLYGNTSENILDLDKVFYVLKKIGTTTIDKYASMSNKFDPALFGNYDLKKIKDVKTLYNYEKDSNSTKLFNEIKDILNKGIPIICDVNQPQSTCEWKDLEKLKVINSKITHIVNIIGYNKNKVFIKNNYENECIHEYNFNDFYKILNWAFYYEL